MRPTPLDPFAGRTAVAIRTHPGAPQLISDPTDSRYGESWPDTAHDHERPRIWDPTDTEYDHLSD